MYNGCNFPYECSKDDQVNFTQILLKQIRKVTKIFQVGSAVFYAGTRSEGRTESTEGSRHKSLCENV